MGRPNHIGDDRSVECHWAVKAQRCHLGVDGLHAFSPETVHRRGQLEK